MLLALHPIDYAVLLLYLVVTLVIGAALSHQQRSTRDFFLAGRSMCWFPVGLSIMATLLSALRYTGIPGESYYVGLKYLLFPLAVWLTLPILGGVVLPMYRRLDIYSVYEYLEMRFGPRTRLVSSLAFVGWRLLWMGGVLFAPCKVLAVAMGVSGIDWLLIVVLGVVATAYTFLGGMKAVIWTDVLQALVMGLGLLLIVGGVWWHLDGGPVAVWQVSEALGRTEVAELRFTWTDPWCLWGVLPHFFLAVLSFYVADQITVQRYLTAKDTTEVRRSFVLNCVSVTVMVPALMYAGMALMAFYQTTPQAMRPIWAVNLDNQSLIDADSGKTRPRSDSARQLTGEDGEPLIGWEEGRRLDEGAINRARVEQLVAQRRLIDPNRRKPFTDADEIYDDTAGRLDIDRLALRRPLDEEQHGVDSEIVLHRDAQDELMPWFITQYLFAGLAGLILAALLAASMSSMDSGLNSISTLLITDVHRRLGVGRAWLARRRGKPAVQLTESDELRLARPMTLVIGGLVIVFALFLSQMGSIFDVMIRVVNTFGGPLLAIFLLGMFTRRTTAAAALSALVGGTLWTVWLSFGHDVAGQVEWLAWMWPFGRLASIWPLVFGVAGTLAAGYGLSFIMGRRKTLDELRGLVAGVGRPGERRPVVEKLDLPEME